MSFSDTEHAGKKKKTRREVFLSEMEQVVSCKALLAVIEPFYPEAERGRRPYEPSIMLRIHLVQNWLSLSDPSMQETLYEIASLRRFAGLTLNQPIPDESTILNFRHRLDANDLAEDIFAVVNRRLIKKGLILKQGSIVDATIIAAPSSTKNAAGERDPEMSQTKKGNQWHFGMKVHIGVDAESGLTHIVVTSAANEHDIEHIADLLRGKEQSVWADAGYLGAPARVDDPTIVWHIAARPSQIAKLPEGKVKDKANRQEHDKASVQAKVGHPFRVVKRLFGFVKCRYRGLVKSTAQIVTLFALSNLWMASKKLIATTGQVRLKTA